MKKKTCIFLGPSLDVDGARRVLDATYLSPVAMGDVYIACCEGFEAIGIIDGLFEQVPSVWHKEITYALSRGVLVYGASSMGALRAVELHAFGMRGVGRIFEAFLRGEYEDDDEVAVVHAPDSLGYRSLSEAMVNIREGLAQAEQAGVISSDAHAALVASAKARFYSERSWPAVLYDGRQRGLPPSELDALAAFLKQTDVNLKRADALALLARMRADIESDAVPVPPNFDFEPSIFWEGLKAEIDRPSGGRRPSDGQGASVESVVNHARVTLPQWWRTARGALLRLLSETEATRLGVEIDEARLKRAAERFRRRYKLISASATLEFLRANRLSIEGFTDVVRSEAAMAAVAEHYRARLTRYAALELTSSGEFGRLAAATERRAHKLAERGMTRPSIHDTGVEVATLLSWYASRAGRSNETGPAIADDLGFEDVDALLTELISQFALEELDNDERKTTMRETTTPARG